MLLDNLLGRIRAPHYAQLTLDTRSGKLQMNFRAQSENGLKAEFEKTYESELITGAAVQDLLAWLRATARQFWGSESGGL